MAEKKDKKTTTLHVLSGTFHCTSYMLKVVAHLPSLEGGNFFEIVFKPIVDNGTLAAVKGIYMYTLTFYVWCGPCRYVSKDFKV